MKNKPTLADELTAALEERIALRNLSTEYVVGYLTGVIETLTDPMIKIDPKVAVQHHLNSVLESNRILRAERGMVDDAV